MSAGALISIVKRSFYVVRVDSFKDMERTRVE